MSLGFPVVAAVPNYNMGEQLEALLPQLRGQDYSDVFVLDDASTDDSRDVVEGLDLGINFVASQENQGAGATRNLIIPNLPYRALIHFIDADTDLQTDRVVEVARDIVPAEAFGFVGGLALNPDGSQNKWNYGPRQCFRTDFFSQVHSVIANIAPSNPERATKLRARFGRHLSFWPDTLAEPERRRVFWNIEQNLLMDSAVFEGVGGFDPRLREHEIQDLAIRMYRLGLTRYFDPSISVKHKAVDVRGYNRNLAMLKAEVQIHRRFGFRHWFKPDGKFSPEF